MHGVLFDHARTARIGLPEAVFCQGKPLQALRELMENLGPGSERPALFTRLDPEVFAQMPESIQTGMNYHALSRTAFARPCPPCGTRRVAVVSAGTADGAVTWEAARTLEYLGIVHQVYEDCGVAGLWRLADRIGEINSFDAVIVVAGLDAALATVLGGLTGKPVFAVPTSVGYGVASHGQAALFSMLSSCAPGVAVLNIDNGYGAACAAARVVHLT